MTGLIISALFLISDCSVQDRINRYGSNMLLQRTCEDPVPSPPIVRRLCVSLVDSKGLAALMVCRLIALDKCPRVRPIGICETAR